jgi:hypothetical protein
MKKKEESEKRERKKEVVCAAVATEPAKFPLISGVQKCEIAKSCLWTRCSTLEYVARNYTNQKCEMESVIFFPCLWTMP